MPLNNSTHVGESDAEAKLAVTQSIVSRSTYTVNCTTQYFNLFNLHKITNLKHAPLMVNSIARIIVTPPP